MTICHQCLMHNCARLCKWCLQQNVKRLAYRAKFQQSLLPQQDSHAHSRNNESLHLHAESLATSEISTFPSKTTHERSEVSNKLIPAETIHETFNSRQTTRKRKAATKNPIQSRHAQSRKATTKNRTKCSKRRVLKLKNNQYKKKIHHIPPTQQTIRSL